MSIFVTIDFTACSNQRIIYVKVLTKSNWHITGTFRTELYANQILSSSKFSLIVLLLNVSSSCICCVNSACLKRFLIIAAVTIYHALFKQCKATNRLNSKFEEFMRVWCASVAKNNGSGSLNLDPLVESSQSYWEAKKSVFYEINSSSQDVLDSYH